MAAAHAIGVIHRDLKPRNVVCVDRVDRVAGVGVNDIERVKVVDFGLAPFIVTNEQAGDHDLQALPTTFRSSVSTGGDGVASGWEFRAIANDGRSPDRNIYDLMSAAVYEQSWPTRGGELGELVVRFIVDAASRTSFTVRGL